MSSVRVAFEDKETVFHLDLSVTTVEMVVSLLGKSLGRSLASHGLFRDSAGRRTTVRVDVLEEKATLASLAIGEDEVLVCAPCSGSSRAQTLRVLVTFADKAVELPLLFSGSCAEFSKLVLEKAQLKLQKVMLVKFKPFDSSDVRHDDWEVLNGTRSLSSYSFSDNSASGYSVLCCREEDFQIDAPVRIWFNLLLDWKRHKKLVKARLRAGVPGWARSQVWALLLDSRSRGAEHPGLFASLVAEAPAEAGEGLSERWESDRKVIFRDVFRTFPTHPFFRLEKQDGQLALQHVLVAWHSMEPNTGYCQGINFIAAVFLLYQDEETAFWSLHALLKLRGLENLYRSSMPLLHYSMDVFQNLIERLLPDLASYFAVNDIVLSSFAAPWFHTLFAWRFPLSLVARLFDVVMREGLSVIFRFGLALLKNRQASIVALDPSEVLMKVQSVEWLLDDKQDDEWLSLTFKIKKTREMFVTELCETPMQRNSILSLAKKMGSNLKQFAVAAKHHAPEYESGGDVEATMWQNSDEGLVVLSPEGEVLAASPEKLLEKLTAVRFPGQQFTEAFLLTYRGFMTPQRLAQLLKWRLQHVPVLAGQSRNDWSKESVEPIHRRVFNLLRLWICLYPRDFDGDSTTSDIEATIALLAAQSATMADRIRRIMASRPRPARPAHPASLRLQNQESEMNAVGEWSPEVFARHLLECDWKQYQSVQPIHLLSSGSSVLAVVRWNGRLSSFVEACVLGSGEREICLKQTDYFVAVAEASLLLNNLSGVIVVMMALRSVAKLFKDAALAKSAKQGRWAYLCSLIEMNAEENQVFLGRFRTGEVVVPWVQPFVEALAMICAEEAETMTAEWREEGGLVNFRRNVFQSKAVHSYLLFQKPAVEPETTDESRRLADLVWGWPDMSLARLQQLADQVSAQTSKWRPRSPRSGGAASAVLGNSVDVPMLGRRKSNVADRLGEN